MSFRVGEEDYLNNLYASVQEANITSTGRVSVNFSDVLEFLGTVKVKSDQSLELFGKLADFIQLVTARLGLLNSAEELFGNISQVIEQISILSRFDTNIEQNNSAIETANNWKMNHNQDKTTLANSQISQFNQGNPTEQITIPPFNPNDPPPPSLPVFPDFSQSSFNSLDRFIRSYNRAVSDYNEEVEANNGIIRDWNDSIKEFNSVSNPNLELLEEGVLMIPIDFFDVNPESVSRNNVRFDRNSNAINGASDLIDGVGSATSLEQKVTAYNTAAQAYNSQLASVNAARVAENTRIVDEGLSEDLLLDPEELPPLPLITLPLDPNVLDEGNSISYPIDPDIEALNELNNDISAYNQQMDDNRAYLDTVNSVIATMNQGVAILLFSEGQDFYPNINSNSLESEFFIDTPLEDLENFYNTISTLIPSSEDLASAKEFLSIAEMTDRVDALGIGNLNEQIEEYNALVDQFDFAIAVYILEFENIRDAVAELSGNEPVDLSLLPDPATLTLGGNVIDYDEVLFETLESINEQIIALGSPEELPLLQLSGGVESFTTSDMEILIEEYLGVGGLFAQAELAPPDPLPFGLDTLELLDTVSDIYFDYLVDAAEDLNAQIENNPEIPDSIPLINLNPNPPHTLESLEEIVESYLDPDGVFVDVNPEIRPFVEDFDLEGLRTRLLENQGQTDFINRKIDAFNAFAIDFNAALNFINHPEVVAKTNLLFDTLPLFNGRLSDAPQLSPLPILFSDTAAGAALLENSGANVFRFLELALLNNTFGNEEDEDDPLDAEVEKIRFRRGVLTLSSGAVGSTLDGPSAEQLTITAILPYGPLLELTTAATNAISSLDNGPSAINYRQTGNVSDGLTIPKDSQLQKLQLLLASFSATLSENLGAGTLSRDLALIAGVFGEVLPQDPGADAILALSDLQNILGAIENGFVRQQLSEFIKSPIFESIFGPLTTPQANALGGLFSPIAEFQALNLAINSVSASFDQSQKIHEIIIGIAEAIEQGEEFEKATQAYAKRLESELEKESLFTKSKLSQEYVQQFIEGVIALLIGPTNISYSIQNDREQDREDDERREIIDDKRQRELHDNLQRSFSLDDSTRQATSLSALETLVSLFTELKDKGIIIEKEVEQTSLKKFLSSNLIEPTVNSDLVQREWLELFKKVTRRGTLQGTSSESLGDAVNAIQFNWSV